jgi:hypothetical protein
MISTIYVKLLEEGTDVYRPVEVEKINENTFRIKDQNDYDEVWEFSPGAIVEVEEKELTGEKCMIAVREKS